MTVYVSEFSTTMQTTEGAVQIGVCPPLVVQALTNGVGSTQSNAFNAATRFVRVHVDATGPVAIEFGSNPTAIIPSGGFGSMRLAANQTEYFGVALGSAGKMAVINTT